MKKILISAIILFIASNLSQAQDQYQVLVERPNEKSLKGIISRDLIQKDTSFKWYALNQKGYNPNKAALEGIKKYKDSIQFLVFMGTWCEDSHVVIPKFFSLLDSAGFSQDRLTLIGVDRQKKTFSHLCEALNVINVPTIIVMKKGVEQGRVVEYGKFGSFDLDLGNIFKAMQ